MRQDSGFGACVHDCKQGVVRSSHKKKPFDMNLRGLVTFPGQVLSVLEKADSGIIKLPVRLSLLNFRQRGGL